MILGDLKNLVTSEKISLFLHIGYIYIFHQLNVSGPYVDPLDVGGGDTFHTYHFTPAGLMQQHAELIPTH